MRCLLKLTVGEAQIDEKVVRKDGVFCLIGLGLDGFFLGGGVGGLGKDRLRSGISCYTVSYHAVFARQVL